MTAIETSPPMTYEIRFTDDDTMHVDCYQTHVDLGYLRIRTTPNAVKYDMFLPLANMFYWKRIRG